MPPSVYLQQAEQLVAAGQHAAAEYLCRQIPATAPDYPQSLELLARILESQSRAQEAALIHGQLGNHYSKLEDWAAAARSDRRAVEMLPERSELWTNLGDSLEKTGDFEEAVAAHRQAVDRNSSSVLGWSHLGVAQAKTERYGDAEDSLLRALALDPNFVHGHWNLALNWLRRGRWPDGWREYEWRRRLSEWRPGPSQKPYWSGEEVRGKTILLLAEQGLGDNIQALRFIPSLIEKGARVLVRLPARLHPLLASEVGRPSGPSHKRIEADDWVRGVSSWLNENDPLPPHDFHAYLLSLPAGLGTTLHTLPVAIPYLQPRPNLVSLWKERLAVHSGLRVGIAWQGNRQYPEDRWRSIPLREFRPLFDLPRCTFFSLQKGPGAEQRSEFRNVIELELDGEGAFVDTAAVVQNLDLVISSDTALVHLAGALGRPAWVALPRPADWRWGVEAQSTPWYPSLRLFRQSVRGDWPGVFLAMAGELRSAIQ